MPEPNAERTGNNQSTGIATGSEVHQILLKPESVPKELHQNLLQLPAHEFTATPTRVFLVCLEGASQCKGIYVVPLPPHLPLTHIQVPTPACRKIRDEHESSFSFGLASGE